LLHEKPDEERWAAVAERIKVSGYLKHPVIAARDHGMTTHLLLDGVNRVEALRRLGAAFVLVQEVEFDDDELTLSSWHHAIEGMDGDRLIEDIQRATKVRPFDGEFTTDDDFVPGFESGTVCCIVLPDRRCYAVNAGDEAEARLDLLHGVVELIHGARRRDRVSYTNLRDLTRHYREFSALVCYRPFSKHDVLDLSLKGLKFPSGVTRFSIPKRALSFNMPLDLLKGETSAEALQERLDDMIREKITGKRIRFYSEPTFYFDD
jgi:hypothetical protein